MIPKIWINWLIARRSRQIGMALPQRSKIDPDERAAVLAAQQALKMARSAHAYVRGSTIQFYEWLEKSRFRDIPVGPPVWICGDCHLGNLGPLADSKGRVDIQIRDLDQTVIGNPAHDLIRLGLSLASAARGSDLPGVTTAHMLEEMIRGYGLALREPGSADLVPEPGVVSSVRRRALGRKWRHLARERIQDVKPSIPLGRKFWALANEERQAIDALFKQPEIRKLVLTLNERSDESDVKVADAAYWMKGCSSLGKLRYAVLIEVKDRNECAYALIDLKEAVEPAAPPAKGVSMPDHYGARVVAGARALSPNLGDRMLSAELLGRPIVIRELMPQDLKLEVDQFSRAEAVAAARYLAYVVGRAHARQMDKATRAGWSHELERRHPDDLNAPNWLWSSIVSLAASHEEAYLEHCRRYALEAA
jgi:uncharacterized protein (DUF2252 family)